MATTYEVCGCGGTVVVTPTRPGVEPKREHRDESGKPTVCPTAR
ncbi:hypothetical protein ACIQ8D_24040 [Streptomyces sp. NPDC096094]